MYTGKKVATFQERFTDLFNESDKTIIELAKDLHVANQTISAWKTPEALKIKGSGVFLCQNADGQKVIFRAI